MTTGVPPCNDAPPAANVGTLHPHVYCNGGARVCARVQSVKLPIYLLWCTLLIFCLYSTYYCSALCKYSIDSTRSCNHGLVCANGIIMQQQHPIYHAKHNNTTAPAHFIAPNEGCGRAICTWSGMCLTSSRCVIRQVWVAYSRPRAAIEGAQIGANET